MFQFSFRAPARYGLVVSAFLTLGTLTACGGDSSDNDAIGDDGPTALVLTRENAASTTQFLLLTTEFVPVLMFGIMEEAVIAIEDPCLNDGTRDSEFDDMDRPLRLTFENCLTLDDETSAYRDQHMMNGRVTLGYESNDPMSPVQLNARGLASRYNSLDKGTDTTESQTVALDGEMRLAPTAMLPAVSLTNVTAAITLTVETAQGGDTSKEGFTWRFIDYDQVVTAPDDFLESMSLDGRVVLGQPFNGYVDLETSIAMTYNETDNCPEAGDLTVHGGEGSYLNIAFADSDTVRVTLNGVTDTLTCSEFDDWLYDAPQPFRGEMGRALRIER